MRIGEIVEPHKYGVRATGGYRVQSEEALLARSGLGMTDVQTKAGESVAGEKDAAGFYRFREAPADRTQHEGGNAAFRLNGQAGRLAGKFDAAVELKARFLKEFRREAEIFGTIHTPKPKFLFVALEEAERFFELLHGPVKGGGEEENGEIPGVAGVLNADADAIFAGLILLDAATVVISNAGRTRSSSFCHVGFP